MSYCTPQDMIDRFGENELIDLTDRDDTGAINADVLGRAIDDASAKIDSYLGSRYQLPIDPLPPILVRYACDIARFNLYDESVPDVVETRHKDATRFLELVAAGKVLLGVNHQGESPVMTDNQSVMSASKPVWHRDTSGGFI